MNATMRFIVWGTIPIGSLMGGMMATLLPVRVALIVAALGSFSSILWVLFSPLRSLHEMPQEGGGNGADTVVVAERLPEPARTRAATT